MRTHSTRKYQPLKDYNATAFCPSCEVLEPFAIQSEAKVSPEVRQLHRHHGGREVIAEFFCGTKAHLMTAA